MTEPKEGLSAAVDVLMAREGTEARRGQQLALIPSPAELEHVRDPEGAERRGPGRPAGSRNRSTTEWVDFITARYRSPLLFLAETYTRPVEQLASELGCSRAEAYKIQESAARDLAPYVHQKQPLAVQVTGAGVIQLILEQPAVLPIAAAGADPGLIEAEILPQQNQEVSKP